jgi:hypothetical protein
MRYPEGNCPAAILLLLIISENKFALGAITAPGQQL